MNTTKRPESQELQSENQGNEGSVHCSECFNGQQANMNLDAMNVTAVNILLCNNKTAIVGNNAQLKICEGHLQPTVLQNTESKSGVSADGQSASSCHHASSLKKRRRRKRKKISFKAQKVSNCDVDGNSADGENSDSDHSDKFKNFLEYDSDD